MGLKSAYLDYIYECARSTIGELQSKRMLELGDQGIRPDQGLPESTGKEYYENRGVVHTSIDLNGSHGALKIDLSKPIDNKDWFNHFDIITNSGTSEHVEPKKAQYPCFMNIHNCLRVGGIAVHLVPDIDELENKGSWRKHCRNYYSHEFFRMLAKNNNYKLTSLKVMDGAICACLQKEQDTPFMKDREEFLKYIARRREGIIYSCINDTGLFRLYNKLCNFILNNSILFPIARWFYRSLGIKRLVTYLKKKRAK